MSLGGGLLVSLLSVQFMFFLFCLFLNKIF